MSDFMDKVRAALAKVSGFKDAVGKASADAVPESWKLTPDQKLQAEIEIAKAKLAAEQFAAPKALWMTQNVPGAKAAQEALNQPKDAEPAPREPIQQEREFSNEADKAEYIAKVRKAMENAKK